MAMQAAELSRYEFDKFDKLSDIKFHCREGVRGFSSQKEHFNAVLVALRKEEPKEREAVFRNSEKVGLLERYVEKIDVGMEELDILLALDLFCNVMDAERVRTRLQVKRLVQENMWLRNELQELQKRLVKLEERVVKAEAEKLHYQFVYKMRNEQRATDEQQYAANYVLDEEDDDDDEGGAGGGDMDEEIPTKVKPIHNLCMDYIREKRYEVVIPLCEEYVQRIRAKQGDTNNEVATLYCLMARAEKEQGNLAEAQKLYEDALRIREKVLGKEHGSVGVTLSNLSQVLYRRNNFKEAEKVGLQALRIGEKTTPLAKNSPDVALLHSHLGLYALHLAKWADVVSHYKAALAVYEQMYDSTDSLIMRAHCNLAKAYVRLKQYDNAAEMLALLCRSFQHKNSSQAASAVGGGDDGPTVFLMCQQHADGKQPDLSAEELMKRQGAYESVLDRDVLDTMIDHFVGTKKAATADILRGWIDLSDKQLNPVVRHSVVARVSRRASLLLEKKSSSASVSSSKKEKSSIMGFFKRDKK